MTVEFTLPDIGEGLHEAEVLSWLVAEGDTIERNQPFVEILTDKSAVEMPAPAAGTVSRLAVTEGEIVRVGELLIVIDDNSANSSAEVRKPDLSAGISRVKASPATRRLAGELGVDLSQLVGTGPGGRILADDVRAQAGAAESQTTVDPTPPSSGIGQMPVGVHPLRGVRRATAKAMDLSWSTIPHVSAMNEIDATNLVSARAQLREKQNNVTPLVLVLLAVARALRRLPVMNATLDLDAETITIHDAVNIGVAVATDYGLMVPVVANADRLDVFAMADELERLSAAARSRTTAADDLAAGTYTVTNFGVGGNSYFASPIIRPGESGITGLGSIAPRSIVIDGEVVARPTLPVVVCGDHRLVDGDVMSAFHNDICQSLLSPIGLLL